MRLSVISKGPLRGPRSTDPIVDEPVFGPCYVVPDVNRYSGIGWLFTIGDSRYPVGAVQYPARTVPEPSAMRVRLTDGDGRRLEIEMNGDVTERAIDRAAVVAAIIGVVGVVAYAHYSGGANRPGSRCSGRGSTSA